MNDQQVTNGLGLLDAEFERQVRSIKSHETLRLFASACASLAFTYCGNGDPRSLAAIEVAQYYAKGSASNDELYKAYTEAEEAAEAADKIAFDVYDAAEKDEELREEYFKKFAAARAAFSARDCCLKSAIEAASNAAYEAWAALNTMTKTGDMLGGLISSEIPSSAIRSSIISILRDILSSLSAL